MTTKQTIMLLPMLAIIASMALVTTVYADDGDRHTTIEYEELIQDAKSKIDTLRKSNAQFSAEIVLTESIIANHNATINAHQVIIDEKYVLIDGHKSIIATFALAMDDITFAELIGYVDHQAAIIENLADIDSIQAGINDQLIEIDNNLQLIDVMNAEIAECTINIGKHQAAITKILSIIDSRIVTDD